MLLVDLDNDIALHCLFVDKDVLIDHSLSGNKTLTKLSTIKSL